MDPVDRAWIVGYFQGKGSFCRVGGSYFCLEAYSGHEDSVKMMQRIAGGSVTPPIPSAPSRWMWRLYGKPALDLWAEIKPSLTPRLQLRGELKKAECVPTHEHKED
jgi:hypothetical protein